MDYQRNGKILVDPTGRNTPEFKLKFRTLWNVLKDGLSFRVRVWEGPPAHARERTLSRATSKNRTPGSRCFYPLPAKYQQSVRWKCCCLFPNHMADIMIHDFLKLYMHSQASTTEQSRHETELSHQISPPKSEPMSGTSSEWMAACKSELTNRSRAHYAQRKISCTTRMVLGIPGTPNFRMGTHKRSSAWQSVNKVCGLCNPSNTSNFHRFAITSLLRMRQVNLQPVAENSSCRGA